MSRNEKQIQQEPTSESRGEVIAWRAIVQVITTKRQMRKNPTNVVEDLFADESLVS